jgi:hypothetical protein
LTASTRLQSNRFEISTAKGSAITIPIGKTRFFQSGGGVPGGNRPTPVLANDDSASRTTKAHTPANTIAYDPEVE